MPRIQRPRGESWAVARALALAAVVCWLAGLAVPFLKGSAKLLLVPIVREFNLPLFLDYLVDAGQGATAAPLAVLLLFAPAALLLWLAAALAPHAWRRLPAPPARAAGLLLALNAGGLLAVRAGAAERATARLLPGAWLLLGGLALGTAAAALLPRPVRRGGRVPAGAPGAAAPPPARAAKSRPEEE